MMLNMDRLNELDALSTLVDDAVSVKTVVRNECQDQWTAALAIVVLAISTKVP